MNRSQQAGRYGRLVEEKACQRYGIELEKAAIDGVRVDARDSRGYPWEIKGAMTNRKRGPGRFRLWRDQHRVLADHDGGYIFVRYDAVARGIRIKGMRSVHARDIEVSWGGSGDHRRDSQQAKLLAREIVND